MITESVHLQIGSLLFEGIDQIDPTLPARSSSIWPTRPSLPLTAARRKRLPPQSSRRRGDRWPTSPPGARRLRGARPLD